MPARRRLIPDHAYSFFPVLFPPLSDFRRRSAARSRRPPKEQPPEAQSPEAQSPAPANAGYALPAARCKTNETHPKALRSRAEHPSGRDRCGELRIMRLPQTARPKAGSRSPPCRKSAMRHLPPIRLHAPGHDESDKKTEIPPHREALMRRCRTRDFHRPHVPKPVPAVRLAGKARCGICPRSGCMRPGMTNLTKKRNSSASESPYAEMPDTGLPQAARPKAGSRSPLCRKSAMRHLPPIRLHAPGHDESDKKTEIPPQRY